MKIAGAGHGWLFVGFVAALLWAKTKREWPLGEAALLFALSLVPFGFLLIDRRLKRDLAEAPDAAA